MKTSFAARRKARRIAQDEDDEDPPQIAQASDSDSRGEQENPTVINRRNNTVSGTNKPKKKSGLRLSFGPGEIATGEDSEDASSAVFTPKKSSLSRAAIEKNAARKSLGHSTSADRLPIRATAADDRPTYSKDYLNELRTSTPSTPKDLKSLSTSASADEADVGKTDTLNILEKFGVRADTPKSSYIPTEAEIREKKERRARLAKEKSFISLNSDDENNNEISLLPRRKKESRLVREDEDLGEGFDEFVEDGGITLGKKAEREQRRRRRAEMENLIHDAERSPEEESDDSEVERRAEYEAAQTRAGAYGVKDVGGSSEPARAKTPPKITPLPSLGPTLRRLQGTLRDMKAAKQAKVKKLEVLVQQKSEIAIREVEIQRLLKEAGDNYERLRVEVGLAASGNSPGGKNGLHDTIRAAIPNQFGVGRGLESFGNSPIPPPAAED